jgi:hypothetical protein
MGISVPHHSFGRSQRAKLPHTRQAKRRTRGRSRLWRHAVEIQEEERGITLAFPCRAHLALSAPDGKRQQRNLFSRPMVKSTLSAPRNHPIDKKRTPKQQNEFTD